MHESLNTTQDAFVLVLPCPHLILGPDSWDGQGMQWVSKDCEMVLTCKQLLLDLVGKCLASVWP